MPSACRQEPCPRLCRHRQGESSENSPPDIGSLVRFPGKIGLLSGGGKERRKLIRATRTFRSVRSQTKDEIGDQPEAIISLVRRSLQRCSGFNLRCCGITSAPN